MKVSVDTARTLEAGEGEEVALRGAPVGQLHPEADRQSLADARGRMRTRERAREVSDLGIREDPCPGQPQKVFPCGHVAPHSWDPGGQTPRTEDQFGSPSLHSASGTPWLRRLAISSPDVIPFTIQ